MIPPLLTCTDLVITQTKSFMVNEFSIADTRGVTIGAMIQSSKLGDFFMGSRSVAVGVVDHLGQTGDPVIVIKDPPDMLVDTYEIYLPQAQELLAKVYKEFSFFKTKLSVESQAFPLMEVDGDFWGFDFSLLSEGRALASITASWKGFSAMVSGKNTYAVSIASGLSPKQHAAIIGVVVALDMLRDKRKNRSA